MAISYLTQAQKDTIDGLTRNVHETFAVNVLAFKINKKTSLTSNPNYNSIYRQNQTVIIEEEQSQEFQARIRYVKMGEEVFNNSDGSSATSVQSRILLPAGSVKMKVDETAHAYIKDCKRVEIASKRYILFGQPRPIGMFYKEGFWEYFLAPTD